jgi:crotonobetainyl-CoA:carnitine CoA-transferase CaiB-like acyl-CoA transferase
MASAFATGAALYERVRTGKGQQIQTSLLRTALTIMNPILIEQSLGIRTRVAMGNRSPIAGPSDIFKTTDGWITVQVIGRDMFQRWADLIGRSDLPHDPRFADDSKRGQNGEELSAVMQAWCDSRSSKDCLAALRAARVPGCRVLSPKDALAEPQIVDGGFFNWVKLNDLDETIPLVCPAKTSSTQSVQPGPAPALGIDSAKVLAELGYSSAEIDAFLDDGIVATAGPQSAGIKSQA